MKSIALELGVVSDTLKYSRPTGALSSSELTDSSLSELLLERGKLIPCDNKMALSCMAARL